ncbi:APA family fibronectin-binding glycoprotein [Actinoplanes sp. GCM10030250]|uniref:serine/threonine-protein kinase n=1 Tax=Actinoplanes sp. GCM10030250 TaxID=3273376 RepID=UPI003619B412
MPDAPPLLAARYRLGDSLGRGGMGEVRLARDETLQRDVAIKAIDLPPGAEDEAAARRTLREARAAARLNHPGVVQVYDVLQLDGRTWIVMEYVPSQSLRQAIAENGPLDQYRVARIGLDLVSALRAAHRAGVEHRDVKPANVLLADDGRVLLTDFGIAAVDDDGVISRSDVVVGSPKFMAPERAQAGASGPEADLWSLGATLYAAVEGRAPFERPSTMATLAALTTEEVPPPRQAGPLRPVLEGLLRKDPARRISAEDAEAQLRQVIAELDDDAPAPARIPRQRTSAGGSDRAPDKRSWSFGRGLFGSGKGDTPASTGDSEPAAKPAQAAAEASEASPASAGAPAPASAEAAAPASADVAVPESAGEATPGSSKAGTSDPSDVVAPAAGQASPSVSGRAAARDGSGTAVAWDGPGTAVARAGSGSAVAWDGSGTAVDPDGGGEADVADWPGDAGAGQFERAQSRRRLLVAAVALVLVLIVGAVWAVTSSGEDKESPEAASSQPAATGSAGATTTAPAAQATENTPAPSSAPAGGPVGGSPASASPSPSVVAGERPPLPAGWREHKDSSGFSVYVPEGWTRSKEKTMVYFRGDGRVLGIDQTDKPKSNPVADWRSQSQYRVSRGDFPAYNEIKIESVKYFRKAADWEFTFTRGGTRQHVNNRGVVVADDKAYGFYWQTRDSEWNAARPDLQLIFDSFRPAS